jgi:hypothetical protein
MPFVISEEELHFTKRNAIGKMSLHYAMVRPLLRNWLLLTSWNTASISFVENVALADGTYDQSDDVVMALSLLVV